MPIARGPDIVVRDSGLLVVEYVKLPIVDLSLPFLYRICQPVQMAWVQGSISALNIIMAKSSEQFPKAVGEYVLKRWQDLVGEAPTLLKPIERVFVSECHITAKADGDGCNFRPPPDPRHDMVGTTDWQAENFVWDPKYNGTIDGVKK